MHNKSINEVYIKHFIEKQGRRKPQGGNIMNITPINTIKYTPLNFKADNASVPTGTFSNVNTNSTDTFESSTAPAKTTTVNKVITSFKKLFAPQENAGKSKPMTDKEVSELIFTRNLLL